MSWIVSVWQTLVLVNECTTDEFNLSRGLRLGILFHIFYSGLNSIFSASTNNGLFIGHKVR